MNFPNEIWAALLGALLGAWITYRFALKLAEKQFEHLREISRLDAWRSAAGKFLNDFSPELSVLQSGATMTGDSMDLLREAYGRHAKAVTTFLHYFPAERREPFQQEWRRHCYGSTEDGEPNSPEDEESLPHDDLLFLHYSNEWRQKSGPGSRTRAIQGLERLLAHARDA